MITAIKARNFLSWEELSFDIKIGVTLIDGWNEDDQTPEGSGKSAILNAACWCLFGKIPKDANIDDVIKEGQKNCEVQVHFDDGSIVRRTRGPNELSMTRSDRLIKGKDVKETQTLIEEFVGLTFETFCQTIYFAQNYTKKFITANQEDKGKILSEVQDLTIFDKAGKEVRSLIKTSEDTQIKLKHSRDLVIKDEELTKRDIASEELRYQHALQQQVQRVRSIELQIRAEEDRLARERLSQMEDIADVVRQLQEAGKLVQEQETSKTQILDAMSILVYDEKLEKAFQDANNLLIAEAGVLNSEIAGIDKLFAKRKMAETQGQRYATRYKQLQTEKEKNLAFIANPSPNCPTCGTRLAACDTSHAKVDVVRIDQELGELTEALTALAVEIEIPIPTKEELSKRLAEIREARANNDARILEIRGVKDRMNRAASHLMAIDQNIKVQQTRIDRLKIELERERAPRIFDMSHLDALQTQLEIENRPVVFDQGPLQVLTDKMTTARNNIEDLTKLIKEKESHLNRLEDLKTGFKEIKSYVFNSMLNEINARTQKYLSKLFEVPVSVRFKNDEMKIETEVKYDGVDRGLGLLSGGQFRRVSLAVDLALSDVITSRKGARVGILILDEYFKDLSESSMEKCLTLLEGRGQPVLLIEHNSIFKNIVNNSITVKLQDGTSTIQV